MRDHQCVSTVRNGEIVEPKQNQLDSVTSIIKDTSAANR
jgi:hypothetical protein